MGEKKGKISQNYESFSRQRFDFGSFYFLSLKKKFSVFFGLRNTERVNMNNDD